MSQVRETVGVGLISPTPGAVPQLLLRSFDSVLFHRRIPLEDAGVAHCIIGTTRFPHTLVAVVRSLIGVNFDSAGRRLSAANPDLIDAQGWAPGYTWAGLIPDWALNKPPALVVTDGDSTLYREEVIDELARHADRFEEVARATAAAMGGKVEFAQSLRTRVKLLAGVPASACRDVGQNLSATAGLSQLRRVLAEAKTPLCCVSGGFNQVLDRFARRFELTDWHANELEIIDDKLTGAVIGKIVDPLEKVNALQRWSSRFSAPIDRSIAVGDGANDIPLLDASGLGVAILPKPALAQTADVILPLPDLRAVLAFTPTLIGYQPVELHS